MKVALAAVLVAVALAGCSDDAPSDPVDAAVDVAIDTPSIDAAGCGADLLFTGEYVEWNSTTADFHGIFDARFTLVDDGRSAATAPNGRVILCIPPTGALRITATEAGHTPAVFQVDAAVFTPAGSSFTARGLATISRNADYGALMTGLTFDASRAHVMVEKRGTAQPFALTGATQRFAYDGAAWTDADQGELVLFPNVPVGSGTATLSSTGGAFVGPTTIELVAGQLTVVPLR